MTADIIEMVERLNARTTAIEARIARIESSCHATSVPKLVHIDAAGAVKARPATTVVSLINPGDMRSGRSAFL